MTALRAWTGAAAGGLLNAAGRWRSWLPGLLLVLGLLALSVLAGMIMGLVGWRGAVFIAALLMFGYSLMVPIGWLFALMLVLVYLLVGQLQYFVRFDKAFWFPYLLGLLLYLRVLVHQLTRRERSTRSPALGPLLWLLVFLVCAVVSSLINLVGPLQWFVAGKEYFFLWSVLLCLLWGTVKPESLLRWLPSAALVLLVLQIPVAAYQRFFVMSQRTGASTHDAVVGLFGGNPEGGGASGAMAVFAVVLLGFIIEAWRAKRIGSSRALLFSALALTPVLLAEVKVILMLIPLVVLITHGQMLLRFPVKALIGTVLGVVFLFGVIVAYQTQFTDPNSRQSYSIEEYLNVTVERNTTLSVSALRGEVGRLAAINFWLEREAANPGPKTLIGYGIGSTRVGSLVLGELPKRYLFKLGRSSLVVHLWEVGLIGTAALLMMFGSSVLLAYRTARQYRGSDWHWVLRGCAVGLATVAVCLPYNTDFVEISQIQLLVMMMMGLVIVLSRRALTQPIPTAGSPAVLPSVRAVPVHRHQGA